MRRNRYLIKRFLEASIIMLMLTMVGCGSNMQSEVQAEVKEETVADRSEIIVIEQIPDEKVHELCKEDYYKELVIKEHDLEIKETEADGIKYIAEDSVSMDIVAANPSGLAEQNISKKVVFGLEAISAEWKVISESCEAWKVDNTGMAGSNWKKSVNDASELKNWFGDDVSGQGELYVHFKNRMGFITPTISEENDSPREQEFYTNGSGILSLVCGENITEINFKINGGKITDDGGLAFNLSNDNGEGMMEFGKEMSVITQKEYDAVFASEEGKIYMEDISTFELNSENITDGVWDKTIGKNADNVSPQLSWETVDGATQYEIFMIDEDANNWLHWYFVTEEPGLKEGCCNSKDMGYVGPYPPETHIYKVYVIAIKEQPADVKFLVDSSGPSILEKISNLDKGTSIESGNVISYGVVEGAYNPE